MIDRILAWLMRPRVARVRRWSFVVTIAGSAVASRVWGVHEGVAVLGARVGLWLAVALAAWRLDGERGEALRDLLMHPRLRALSRVETDVMTALPRLVLVRVGGLRGPGRTYERGTFGVALALAFTPMIAAEGLVLHLLLLRLVGVAAAWISTAVHAYTLLWVWGWALGPRAYPHRVGPRGAVLRVGCLYRVRIPAGEIESAQIKRTATPHRGLVETDGLVMLPVRGRTDVVIHTSAPVRVQRPCRPPLLTCWLAVASDAPADLVDALLSPPVATGDERRVRGLDSGLGILVAADLLAAARDSLHPA